MDNILRKKLKIISICIVSIIFYCLIIKPINIYSKIFESYSSDVMTIYIGDTAVWGKDAGTTYNPVADTYNTPTPPAVVSKKCEHNYIIDNDACVMATCQENGRHIFKCSKCGDVNTEVVEASDQWHNWEKTDKDYVEATCSTPMEVTFVCSVCGEEKRVTRDLKGAHKFEDTTIEATCTEEGKIVHTCTLCGHTEEEAIPTIPHAYAERIAKEPSYFTTGVKESTCVMCGDVEHTELIPALWETWQQVVVICIPVVIIALGIVLAIVIRKRNKQFT